MNTAQHQTFGELLAVVEAAENMIGPPTLTVEDGWEWEDSGHIKVVAWAGGVGAPLLIDRDGTVVDIDEGEPARLVIVPDTIDKHGRNKFSYTEITTCPCGASADSGNCEDCAALHEPSTREPAA